MPSIRRALRLSGYTLAAALGAYVVTAGGPSTPTTEIGTAGVSLGDDTARVVERVVYRQDVIRVGDVVLVDGAPATPITDESVAAVWDIVLATWPTELLSDLRQLSVISEEERGLVGVVHPSTTGGWILSLDAADLGDPALLEETIVHELSHVVTLGSDVFTFGGESCGGVAISLGCAHEGSVLAEFAATFWPDDEAGHPHEHVNDYATSAVHEDLAETFTALVLGWAPAGEVIEAKIALLEADPELEALAAELRHRLGIVG